MRAPERLSTHAFPMSIFQPSVSRSACERTWSPKLSLRFMGASMQARAAVDDERLPGDEIAVGAREEDDGAREVFRPLHALERARRRGLGAHPYDALVRVL